MSSDVDRDLLSFTPSGASGRDEDIVLTSTLELGPAAGICEVTLDMMTARNEVSR